MEEIVNIKDLEQDECKPTEKHKAILTIPKKKKKKKPVEEDPEGGATSSATI